MSTHSLIYVGSTTIMRVDALTDADGNYVNDATVTMESLLDSNGTAVSGVTVPLTLSYVSASDGRYEGTVSHSLGITANQWYTATFLAIDGTTRAQWSERLRAVTRTG